MACSFKLRSAISIRTLKQEGKTCAGQQILFIYLDTKEHDVSLRGNEAHRLLLNIQCTSQEFLLVTTF